MVKKLSVILPIYNTNKELQRCLDSIMNQTYTNLEIICIDDGSTDGSEEIVDQFARVDSRFKVVHQKNAGESNARNVGLSMATGSYIAFCDCDDWIELNMYETMINAIEEEQLDLVCVSWYKDTLSECIAIKNELPVIKETFGQKQLLKYLYMRDSYRSFAYIWNKIYRIDILREVDSSFILFDENLKLGGDILYLAKIALNVKSARYIDTCFYHYNQREESGCHTKDISKLMDWITAYEMVINLFNERQIDKEIIDYVKRFLAYHSSNVLEIALEQNDSQNKQRFQNIMKKYKEEYMRLNQGYPERIKRYNNLLEK